MPRGHPLSEDLRWVIVHMSTRLNLDIPNITDLTMVPRRTIERILSQYRNHDRVRPQRSLELRGRRRVLEYDDLAVCFIWFVRCHSNLFSLTISWLKYLQGLLEHRSDLYLHELKESLAEVCGVDVSEKTIWESLRRTGFRLKQACRFRYQLVLQLNSHLDYKACCRTKRRSPIAVLCTNGLELHSCAICICRRERL